MCSFPRKGALGTRTRLRLKAQEGLASVPPGASTVPAHLCRSREEGRNFTHSLLKKVSSIQHFRGCGPKRRDIQVTFTQSQDPQNSCHLRPSR